MHLEHDPEVNAVYIYLLDLPQAYTEELDDSRILDYAADDKPIGIELLNVQHGIILDGLPEREAVEKLLKEHGLKVLASPSIEKA